MGLRPGRATVLLGGRTGCPSCDAGKGCGAGIFGRLISRKPVSLEIKNRLPLVAGQAVMVGIPEALFLRLLAGFYLLPVLAGVLGAALGQVAAVSLQLTQAGQDLLAFLGALFFAALTLLIRRKRDRMLLGEQTVQILGSADPGSSQFCQLSVAEPGSTVQAMARTE